MTAEDSQPDEAVAAPAPKEDQEPPSKTDRDDDDAGNEGEVPAAAESSPPAVPPVALTETVSEEGASTSGPTHEVLRERRSDSHAKLRAYESRRRTAYGAKMRSSSLYWRAFRSELRDSLDETRRADVLLRGWTSASESYGAAMASVGGWCIDPLAGVPIVDPKKKKKFLDAGGLDNAGHQGGVHLGGGFGGGSSGAGMDNHTPHSPGSMAVPRRAGGGADLVERTADSAGVVADRYCDNAAFMRAEVLPELSSLHEQLKKEVAVMEKLGDAIINELESAENEATKTWGAYYEKTVEINGATDEILRERRAGATATASNNAPRDHHRHPSDPDGGAVDGCTDVWLEEMRYRMAVAFLSSCWTKCSSELSGLFTSMKDAERHRRDRLKELLIAGAQRQERLWLGLPGIVTPVLKDLIEWPTERRAVEDDVQSSIRERAQAIQREEAERRKKTGSVDPAGGGGGGAAGQGLSGVDPGDGDFELSSPLVSDLMRRAKVIEKRGGGMMSGWRTALAVVTADSFLQLFELPPSCKLRPGSAPEVAFQNLIPPVAVPTMEGARAGAKLAPSARGWFGHLVPSESLALPNCVVSLKDKDGKADCAVEIVETVLTSGASKMFTKTLSRKLLLRAVTRDESLNFMEALKSP